MQNCRDLELDHDQVSVSPPPGFLEFRVCRRCGAAEGKLEACLEYITFKMMTLSKPCD